jgi:hypothetical protein
MNPKTYKAAMFKGIGNVEVVDLPYPECGDVKPSWIGNGADQSFLEAPELGASGALLCQDEWNVEKVQRGINTAHEHKGLTLEFISTPRFATSTISTRAI